MRRRNELQKLRLTDGNLRYQGLDIFWICLKMRAEWLFYVATTLSILPLVCDIKNVARHEGSHWKEPNPKVFWAEIWPPPNRCKPGKISRALISAPEMRWIPSGTWPDWNSGSEKMESTKWIFLTQKQRTLLCRMLQRFHDDLVAMSYNSRIRTTYPRYVNINRLTR